MLYYEYGICLSRNLVTAFYTLYVREPMLNLALEKFFCTVLFRQSTVTLQPGRYQINEYPNRCEYGWIFFLFQKRRNKKKYLNHTLIDLMLSSTHHVRRGFLMFANSSIIVACKFTNLFYEGHWYLFSVSMISPSSTFIFHSIETCN